MDIGANYGQSSVLHAVRRATKQPEAFMAAPLAVSTAKASDTWQQVSRRDARACILVDELDKNKISVQSCQRSGMSRCAGRSCGAKSCSCCGAMS